MKRGFEKVNKSQHSKEVAQRVVLPLRATRTSAGYDFYTPVDLEIKPQEQVNLWTDIKVKMPEGEFLLVCPPSSVGTKKHCMMANTIGIVDQDYYNEPKREGNIGVCLKNTLMPFELKGFDCTVLSIPVPIIKDLTKKNTVHFKAGDKVAQGIFLKHETAENCNSNEVRKGGYGSTTTRAEREGK